MGELRNVETHTQLAHYPSTSTPWAPCSVSSREPPRHGLHPELGGRRGLVVPAAPPCWREPVPPMSVSGPTAGTAATAAALSASFTAVPYVSSTPRRSPIWWPTDWRPGGADHELPAAPRPHPACGAGAHRRFSTHITGGVTVVTFVARWLWECCGTGPRSNGRLPEPWSRWPSDTAGTAAAVPRVAAGRDHRGHEFVTHEGRKKALFDAIVQHTRHLNDFPIQNIVIALAPSAVC